MAWLIKEQSLLESLLNLPELDANEAMLPSEGPNEFKKSKMLFNDATSSVLSEVVNELLDKRLFNVFACSVTSPCISPTSACMATREASTVVVIGTLVEEATDDVDDATVDADGVDVASEVVVELLLHVRSEQVVDGTENIR